MSVPPKRPIKGKGHGDQFIALGTAPVVQVAGSAPSKAPIKREGQHPTGSSGSSVAKKPRLDKPISVESYELLHRLENEGSEERTNGYILASLTSVKASRGKDSLSMLTLLYHGKQDPAAFQSEQLIEMLVSYLKRDPGFSFKSKPSNALQIFAANLLLCALRDSKSWPISLIKVFVEDSLAERIWVDTMEVKGLVDNILTGFRTFVPTKSIINPDLAAIKAESSHSPSHNEDSSDAKDISSERLEDVTIIRRFTPDQEEQISAYIKDIINEQLSRKPASEISRNLLRLLMATVGVQSIRFLIAQKLDVWLQNPKLQKPSQDLCRILILNLTDADTEVVATLVKSLHKIRSKPIVNHFVSCVKELVLMKEEMSYFFLRESVICFMGEVVTASRGSNNMQVISTILTSDSREKSTRILATLFQEFLIKEDCIKTLRILLREVVRTLRYDHLSLTLFVTILVEEHQSFAEINLNDPLVRDRVFQSTIDIISLCMFLCVSPSVKEAASASKSDKRDVMKNFQSQVADITRSGIVWLQFTAMKLMPDRNEFMHGLNKLLLMEGQEQYCSRDNWPPESERNLIFRLCCEVPFLEDTLTAILNMALTRGYPITPTEAIEVADCLIKRAAGCYDGDASNIAVLEMRNEEVFDLLLNCSTYRIPDNIALPAGYEAPNLAVSDWYWKVWVQLLILTAHNAKTFGHKAWQAFPTLSLLIEMAITSHFEFPPPTQPLDEIRLRDSQLNALEKQQILQFETHLAAASTKMLITESTSLLISKLITFDPMGVARKPPSNILEQLKVLNNNLKLGHLLCQSRNPDFLLEIIQRQQKSKTQRQDTGGPVSMPWLNQLVELHEDNFSALPVQCLCEFLLGQIHEDVCNGSSYNLSKNNTSTMTSSNNSAAGTADKVKEKEKKRKLKKLIVFFKNMLLSNASVKGEEQQQEESLSEGNEVGIAKEMIDYFMKRLGCQQSLFRSLASKALDLIMAPTATLSSSSGNSPPSSSTNAAIIQEQNQIQAQQQPDFSFDSSSFSGNNNNNSSSECLFLDVLPSSKVFESVKQVACEALRWSLLVETNPQSICKYVKFLADHSLHSDSDIALNLAHLLIERQIVTRAIVSSSSLSSPSLDNDDDDSLDDDENEKRKERMKRKRSDDEKLKRSFLTSSNKILYNYLSANMLKDPIQDWPVETTKNEGGEEGSQSERVLVLWQSTGGQTIVIHSSIIQAIVMLLIYGPVEGCQQIYEYQMNLWFNQCPRGYSLETREEIPLWPEPLKQLMVKSVNETLVDAALAGIDTSTLVFFIQSFGIPVPSMDKLLKLLDDRCQVEEERIILKANIMDENFMKQLIEVQWMRGAVNGERFASFLGLDAEQFDFDSNRSKETTSKSKSKKGAASQSSQASSSSSKSGKKNESPSKKKNESSNKSINCRSSSSTTNITISSLAKAAKMFSELLKVPLPTFVADEIEEDEQVDERHIQALFNNSNNNSTNKKGGKVGA